MASAASDRDSSPSIVGLPRPLTPLFGREGDLAALHLRLLDDATRLLTLVGPGGCGKTRLAIAVACTIAEETGTPVVFVDLAPVRKADGIIPALARVLSVPDDDDHVVSSLSAQSPLLVLDNLEQIADAAGPMLTVLERCPGLTIVATSRRPLGIGGEQLWPVAPLPLPAGDDPSTIATNPAVALFIARVRLVRPDFSLTASNAETIAEIVRRLDGLPLAIELAAARGRFLSSQALLARLSHRLTVLVDGAHTLPARQQTMGTAIAWSHDLLTRNERLLYATLGVFAGGFTLEAAEAVSRETGVGRRELMERSRQAPDSRLPSPVSLFDTLSSLVDHSLVQTLPERGGAIRFAMLETVREDALERLAAEGMAEAARNRHAGYFLEFALAIEPALTGAEQGAALDRLEEERANLTEALDWLVERPGAHDALRLAGALWRFWFTRGSPAEGRRRLERIIAAAPDAPLVALAKALNGLGALAYLQGDTPRARAAFETAATIWGEAGDERGRGGGLNNLALIARRDGRYDDAAAGFEEACRCFRAAGDEASAAFALDNLGYVAQAVGDASRARALHEEALGIHERLGNPQGIAAALHNLGVVAAMVDDDTSAQDHHEREIAILRELGDVDAEAYALNSLGHLATKRGDLDEADRRYDEALGHWCDLGSEPGIALATHNLGLNALRRGLLPRAADLLRQSLTMRARLGSTEDLTHSLRAAAEVARLRGKPDAAVRLFGAAHELQARSGAPAEEDGEITSEMRSGLGDEQFRSSWEAGRRLAIDQVVGLALALFPGEQERTGAGSTSPIAPENHGLTARELDVLRLVAAGKTNAGIGKALFISPFTAKTHVANLLGKLGVENRAAATRWAVANGLA